CRSTCRTWRDAGRGAEVTSASLCGAPAGARPAAPPPGGDPFSYTFRDCEVEHIFEQIGRRVMLLDARELDREQNDTQRILRVIEGVTERRDPERTRHDAEVLATSAPFAIPPICSGHIARGVPVLRALQTSACPSMLIRPTHATRTGGRPGFPAESE